MDKYGISLTKRFLSTPSARRATQAELDHP